MTYCNKSISVLIWPLILMALFFVIVFGYKKEIKSGPYIKQEVQGLGEKTIYYYKDVNIFIMEKSHSEIIR